MIYMDPMIELMLWSMGLSGITVLISRFLADQKEIRKIRSEMSFFKEKMDQAKKSGDVAKAEQFMNDMLKASNKQLKHTMKPLMVSMVVFIVAFQFLGTQYADLTVMLPVALPFLGAEVNWFWWYFITIVPTSMFLRRFLDVQ